MKKMKILVGFLIVILSYQSALCQNGNQSFKMSGIDPHTIELDQTFTSTVEISPFGDDLERIYGLALNADISLMNDNSLVSVILIDNNYEEHLVYEMHALLAPSLTASINELCEETSILNSMKPRSLRIEVTDATINLSSLTYTTNVPPGLIIAQTAREKKQARNTEKINKINQSIKSKGKHWIAGPTDVSELSYSERKKLYGQSTFPPGFEYYAGGILQIGNTMKSSPSASAYVNEFDWRNRHGQNWITPIKNQGGCGSCWAFAAVGATEAIANVYYNNSGLDLNLSEQDMLSCSGAGSCDGGYPSTTLSYITNTGVIDEAAFPYAASDLSCSLKNPNPSELIKISGRIDFGSSAFPKTVDNLKKMIINYGPISGGIYDWSHAMVLAGYKVVEEGDVFRYADGTTVYSNYGVTIGAGDPLIGKTVWIFKNSWGNWGDGGYAYFEVDISRIGWTHALVTPVQSLVVPRSVQCTDNDGDGYYYWGLGDKPAGCGGFDQPDGDDSNANLGPMDEFGNCEVISGPPIANFTASNTTINVGGQVTFTDASNGASSRVWTFEGGNPAESFVQNPTVQYNSAGTFDVTLVATNANGSDELLRAGFITVTIPPPLASFSAEPTAILMGQTVKFTDHSEYCTSARSWAFEGGDPGTSTDLNPEVLYTEPGVFNVSLTVTNGITNNTETKTEYITVTDPSIIVYCPSQGIAANEWISSVQIGDMNNNSGNNIAAYEDFTDGKLLTAELGQTLDVNMIPGFNPRSKFEYWSIWIDFDNNGQFDSGERLYTASKKKSTVTGTLTIPGGESTGEYRMRISMSRGSLPSGCGDIGLGQVEDYSVVIIDAVPKPPQAIFSADKRTVEVGEVVTFTDQSTNNPDSRLWTFPGGVPASSTASNPVVTYNTIGVHDVSLVVSKAGFSNSEEIKQGYISVTDVIPPDLYCAPTGINSSSDFIKNASIDGVIGGITLGDGYSLSIDPVSMNPGVSYNFSMTPNVSRTRNFWRLWIDFDQSGSFESGELLLSADAQKGPFSGSINIPEGASGVTRMRISMRNNGAPTPCSDGFKGEVEDYTVNFSTGKSSLINSGNLSAEQSIVVYPNPSSDYLFVRFMNWDGRKTVRLMDMTGRTLMEEEVMGNVMEFDLTSFPKGIYLIDVDDNKIRKTEKISKL